MDLLISTARQWVKEFTHWYNTQHQHSAIRYVTPEQRHKGEDKAILANRKRMYEQAKATTPNRWSGNTRNWEPITEVHLNPEKEKTKAA